MADFNYQSKQIAITGGDKLVKNVNIKNGKGYKSVKRYYNGKCNHTMKRNLMSDEIKMIRRNKYIHGLFNDCYPKRRTSRTLRRRGVSSQVQ
jgi:hypothetical protein